MADPEIYNLFAAPAPDPATVDYQMYETKTDPSVLGDVAQTNQGTIRLLTRDIDSWCLPHDAILRVKFIINKAANAPLLAEDNVTLINGGWNLFKDIKINLNGKQVDYTDQPGVVQLMRYYGESSNHFDTQTCDNAWFYPELPARADSRLVTGGTPQISKYMGLANPYDVSGVLPNADNFPIAVRKNESYRKRWNRTRSSQAVELWLKLSDVSGYCQSTDKVVRGVSFEVVLTRETSFEKILHANQSASLSSLAVAVPDLAVPAVDARGYKVVVQEVSLWMPRLVPSQAVGSALEAQLAASAQTKYMFDQMTTYQSEEYIANGATQQPRWKVVSEAHRPVLALVAFQTATQYNRINDFVALSSALAAAEAETYAVGTRAFNCSANAGLFSRLGDITGVEMRVNQRILPVESYKISFTDESCVRAYNDYKKAFNKDLMHSDSIMSFDMWRESPIFAFDLSMIGDDQIYQNVKTNDIEIRATVTSGAPAAAGQTTLAGNYRILCVLYTEVEMKVDAVNGRLVYVP